MLVRSETKSLNQGILFSDEKERSTDVYVTGQNPGRPFCKKMESKFLYCMFQVMNITHQIMLRSLGKMVLQFHF